MGRTTFFVICTRTFSKLCKELVQKKTYRVACRRMLISAPLQLISSGPLAAFGVLGVKEKLMIDARDLWRAECLGIQHWLERGHRQESQRLAAKVNFPLSSHCEDVRRSRGEAPRLLNLRTKWRCEPA
jgi:hypothetical protein